MMLLVFAALYALLACAFYAHAMWAAPWEEGALWKDVAPAPRPLRWRRALRWHGPVH